MTEEALMDDSTLFESPFSDADIGSLPLQICGHCAAVNYPPRAVCGDCLADALEWQQQSNTSGVLLSRTRLGYSLEPVFQPQLPMTIGSIKLDIGPVVIAFIPADLAVNSTVNVAVQRQACGAALTATAASTEN